MRFIFINSLLCKNCASAWGISRRNIMYIKKRPLSSSHLFFTARLKLLFETSHSVKTRRRGRRRNDARLNLCLFVNLPRIFTDIYHFYLFFEINNYLIILLEENYFINEKFANFNTKYEILTYDEV